MRSSPSDLLQPSPCFPISNFNIWNCIAMYATANCVSLQSRTSFHREPARKIPRLVHWGRSPILSNLVLFKAVWTANMSIMSRRESINVHSICPDNQIRFMCHPSPTFAPTPPPSFRKSLKKTFVRQVSGDRKLYTSRKIMLDHKKYASLVKRWFKLEFVQWLPFNLRISLDRFEKLMVGWVNSRMGCLIYSCPKISSPNQL